MLWKLFVHSDAHSGLPWLLRREWQTQDWDKLDQQGWEPTSRIQQRLMWFPFELQDMRVFVHKVHLNIWKSCCTGRDSDLFGCLVAGCDVFVLTKSTSCGSDEAFCTDKVNPARINKRMPSIDEGWVVTCFLVIERGWGVTTDLPSAQSVISESSGISWPLTLDQMLHGRWR